MKIRREELRRDKEEEIVDLKETVMKLRQQNEKERLKALELEAILTKHKQRVEKQRRWAETQSSYRLCLERMIRDTMHQYAIILLSSSIHRQMLRVCVFLILIHLVFTLDNEYDISM